MVQSETSAAVISKLSVLGAQADQVRLLVDKLRQRVDEGELATGNGISFLEVKHHTMLSYITNLTYLTLLKLHGRQIEGHAVISHLVEDRTVLEKMKPLEQRLKYQIDKLMRGAVISSDAVPVSQPKMATTDDPEAASVVDDSAKLAAAMLSDDALANPSAFKPNPGSLAADVREGDELAIEEGLYRAPKQMPVHYEEDGNTAAKREREEQRMMDRAARSRLVRDLMTEYDDRPEMASASGNPAMVVKDSRMERLAEDRTRYEEDNFTRLTMGRKERRGLGTKLAGLDDEFAHLNDFAGIASLKKTAESSGSKAAILDRLKQMKLKDNESPAEKARRRRRGGQDSDDEVFGTSARPTSNKKGKFQVAKRRMSKR
ncbi:hypothetical protein GGI04_004450 [Coemansia thaxteri]|uniref:Neuroguidin n=1 Tax=Coemansia thaxteri TaxID=2663907 RepID=A0A9W8EK60_9FUNG|nr:hypothetical protein GGI04_004450 [Coemansia thaxteri]KAJ2008005.1 hypothetical protein H4R26_000441 [Coemansia thaxteri]KAJ2470044.1 hypothetical protein GGI02_003193 [Coemansia sp. RSA 2322]KAJ2486166.1 hypothetical protein EV174_001277 [Coemansia sp. RSA 2320]